MDENEDSVSLDFNASCRYREQVLAYTRYWLGLEPIDAKKSILTKALSAILPNSKGEGHWTSSLLGYLGVGFQREPPCPNGPCSSFKEFGQEVQRAHTRGLSSLKPRHSFITCVKSASLMQLLP